MRSHVACMISMSPNRFSFFVQVLILMKWNRFPHLNAISNEFTFISIEFTLSIELSFIDWIYFYIDWIYLYWLNLHLSIKFTFIDWIYLYIDWIYLYIDWIIDYFLPLVRGSSAIAADQWRNHWFIDCRGSGSSDARSVFHVGKEDRQQLQIWIHGWRNPGVIDRSVRVCLCVRACLLWSFVIIAFLFIFTLEWL